MTTLSELDLGIDLLQRDDCRMRDPVPPTYDWLWDAEVNTDSLFIGKVPSEIHQVNKGLEFEGCTLRLSFTNIRGIQTNVGGK